ncbi:CPBP family intramembrane glutamic endopeptidase [Brevundimonas sp. PWP3-1b1]|uniref:CPBP family intramembrane glutamic endopeptidase n=1 Tax=unclassified Brevundimonas TaxID=2622653 RepID=UPI003CFBAE52
MSIAKISAFVIAAIALTTTLLFGSVAALDVIEPWVATTSGALVGAGASGADLTRLVGTLWTGVMLLATCLGVFIPLRLIFRTRLLSILTTTNAFRWRLATLGFAVMFAIQSAALIATIGMDRTYGLVSANVAGGLVFGLTTLLVYLLAAPLEEIVFRRWLLLFRTGTALRCLFLSATSAFVFSLAHLSDDWTMATAHFVSGLAYAWPVVRLRGLEFSMGAHVAKNVSLAYLIGLPGERKWGDEVATAVLATMGASVAIALVAEAIYRRGASTDGIHLRPGVTHPTGTV